MKKIYTLTTFIFLLLVQNTFGWKSIPAHQPTSFFKHMAEVNTQWHKQINDQTVDLLNQKEIHFTNDIERIQTHLIFVESILKNRDVSHLNPQQQTNRVHHLSVLKQYWKRNLYPKNTFHPNRQPYFVDINGTHCAVGYLIEKSGGTKLVQKIKKNDNYSYIHELVLKYPEIEIWATENGFTIDELAWIQPAYAHGINNNIFETSYDVCGIVHTMYDYTTPDLTTTMLIVGGDFTSINATDGNNIMALDIDSGTFTEIGGGLPGTVNDLKAINGYLVAGGDFGTSNIAVLDLDNNSWDLHSVGSDIVLALEVFNDKLYIGGENTASNKIYDLQIDNSNPNGYTFQDQTPSNFTVNSSIRDFELMGNTLIVGGEFTSTNDFATQYIATWDGTNWVDAFTDTSFKVNRLMYRSSGHIFYGGYQVALGSQILATLKQNNIGEWENYTHAFTNGGNLAFPLSPSFSINMFLNINDTYTYFSGEFTAAPENSFIYNFAYIPPAGLHEQVEYAYTSIYEDLTNGYISNATFGEEQNLVMTSGIFTRDMVIVASDKFENSTSSCDVDYSKIFLGEFSHSNYTITPIEMAYFKGNNYDGTNHLYWGTVSETDNAYFSIQRSEDGRNFYEIDQVTGAGTTSIAQNYEFIDNDYRAEISYYRIVDISASGEKGYSKVIAVESKAPRTKIFNLLGNVIENELKFNYLNNYNEVANIQLLDMSGKIILQRTIKESQNLVQISTVDLPSGMYILNFENGIQRYSHKIIKL